MTLFVVFLCIQGVESFSVEWLLSSIFPVVCGKYWFFSAYIFMMLVSPLLNIVIERINKKTHLAICVVSIVLGILAGDVHIVPQNLPWATATTSYGSLCCILLPLS